MHTPIEPHGGRLIDRFVPAATAASLQRKACKLPRITLDAMELADLELIATGAASPLRGFLGSADYTSVVERMRLANGIVWPLPMTLTVPELLCDCVATGDEVALFDSDNHLWGVLEIEEVFERDNRTEARLVFGTESRAHPGVARLLDKPTTLVGGDVRMMPLPTLPFSERRLTPRALRAAIAARGWKRVAGFQTRNPIHRAHEHLTKLALEFADGIVIHPLVGETKSDDVPAAVRFRSYEALIAKYYPLDRTMLAAFPAAMRYAGPREAVFHAIARKNYGITHFIVGRDHAGVGGFYEPLQAQMIFDTFTHGEIGITPLKFDPAFYCHGCECVSTLRTCPHDPKARLDLSGTKVRELLRAGANLPREFTRPEVAEILREYYSTLQPEVDLGPEILLPRACADPIRADSTSVAITAAI